MKPIYRKNVIAAIPKRWQEQYYNGVGRGWYDEAKKAIWQKLSVTQAGLTAEQADKIIGNGSWSRLVCDVCCKNDCDIVWRVGEVPDYDARWVDICPDCIAELAQKAKDTPQ